MYNLINCNRRFLLKQHLKLIDKEVCIMKSLNEKKLRELVNRLSLDFFNEPFRHYVTYNYRLRTTGGRYIPSKKTIEVNPKYVVEMSESDYIGIIKHELVHYHLHIKGKGYNHGDESFKQLLKTTGSPRYCKPLSSTKRRVKHMYICSSCNYVYKRIRRVDVTKRRCGRCSGRIEMMPNRGGSV